MTRVNPVTKEKATGEVKGLFEALQKKMNGALPNIFQNMGNSAAVLKGYVGLSDAVSGTTISPQLREMIALTVGEANKCGYCLAAHTMIGEGAGLKPQEMMMARKGSAADPKTTAILKFVKQVVDNRAKIGNEAVAELKSAGVTDTEIVEIILTITLNLFTNYFNLITDTKIDFPQAPALT